MTTINDLLLYTMMPVMMLLRLADGNQAAMDKVYYFVRRIDEILDQCCSDFDNETGPFSQTVFTCQKGQLNIIQQNNIPLVLEIDENDSDDSHSYNSENESM